MRNNIKLSSFETILEFGCGCGRVLREFSELENAELYGSDYNPKFIKWCQKNLYCADFSINKLEPPLHFENSKFDFIYLISVFTHLPKSTQMNWLKELHRITKENKYVLITLQGDNAAKALSEKENKVRTEEGYMERNLDKPGSNHFASFHTKQCFEAMIKDMFRIIDISCGGKPNYPSQDLYLLQKID